MISLKKISVAVFLTGFAILSLAFVSQKNEGPYLATGIKIGEVTQTSAIVWARLTITPERVGNDAPMPDIKYKDPKTGELTKKSGKATPIVTFPEGYTINTIQGATPGSEGNVRLKYKAKDAQKWIQLDWHAVNPQRAFAYQFELSGLSPEKEYELLVEASPLDSKTASASMEGSFKTAPAADVHASVNFIVVTGTSYPDVDSENGYKLYPSALKLHPDFFVHTGDILYYDALAKTADLARWHWDILYSFPNNIDFHRQVPSYFEKDDHDTWMNDCYPDKKTNLMGTFTFKEGQQIFLDEVPMGKKTYRTIRWGKDLQIWLPEGRDFRSSNTAPDGPGKTIWGKEQIDWFKKTVKESDATFKVLISETPLVGPDRESKADNYANAGFKYEGDMLRKFISEQKNMVVATGDRHWQYISKDAVTGLLEFSCGPGADAHAGGWKQGDKLPEHLYLNVVGGFMEGSVSQIDGKPTLIFRHYNPDGKLLNEYKVPYK
jgi:alkaline phosphatase D